MWTYRWCHLSIESSFELPELPEAGLKACATTAASAATTWHVTLETGAPPERRGREWFHRWLVPDGREWVAFARDSGGYLLRFPEHAEFDVVPSARSIGCYSLPATPLHTLRHLLLDQVLPLIAGDRDRLAIHGSAVATGRGALVFIGDSGDGKSTLAAALARRGHALLTDDCCLLVRGAGGFDVVPAYPGVRLAPASIEEIFGGYGTSYTSVAHYTAKRRVTAETEPALSSRSESTRLSRIYVLAPEREAAHPPAVSTGRRTHRQALFDVLNYTFHLDVGDPVRLREAFVLAADIAQTCDVRSVTVPWELSKLEEITEAVLGD